MSIESIKSITEVSSMQLQPKQETAKKEKIQKVESVKKQDKPAEVKNESEAITVDQEKLKQIVDKLKEQMPNAEAKFGVHEKTNRILIKMVDKETQKVIKEFPLEKTLDQLARTLDLAGSMVDEKL